MSYYRQIALTIFGFKDYTKRGYDIHSQTFNEEALNVDLTGKTAVVTGANSGLGKHVTSELFKRGATVYMLCRNEQRGEEARQDILSQTKIETQKEVNESLLKLYIVDISDLKRIKEFVNQLNQEGHCHILVNNAGGMIYEQTFTKYGFESSFSTNILGTYFLTEQLIPLLQKSGPDARVVTVSSSGMFLANLDISDSQFKKSESYDGQTVYSVNKRQQVELNKYWAKVYPESTTGIKFFSMHPGWADTPGFRTKLESFYAKTKNIIRSTAEGADTIIWAAISKEVDDIPNGSFLFDRKVESTHLPFARTGSTEEEIEKFANLLDKLSKEVLEKDY